MPQPPSLYQTRTRDSELYPSNASVKSVPRPRSPASSISVPFAPSPIIPSTSTFDSNSEKHTSPAAPKRSNGNRASWTSGLWVWNKKQPKRKGSAGSLASFSSAQLGTPGRSGERIGVREQEEDADIDGLWRRGDGGSSPAFKAIFLATVSCLESTHG